eukprot:1427172-Rhodomonas_salina.2
MINFTVPDPGQRSGGEETRKVQAAYCEGALMYVCMYVCMPVPGSGMLEFALVVSVHTDEASGRKTMPPGAQTMCGSTFLIMAGELGARFGRGKEWMMVEKVLGLVLSNGRTATRKSSRQGRSDGSRAVLGQSSLP